VHHEWEQQNGCNTVLSRDIDCLRDISVNTLHKRDYYYYYYYYYYDVKLSHSCHSVFSVTFRLCVYTIFDTYLSGHFPGEQNSAARLTAQVSVFALSVLL
jgi:hypothetical protein